MSHSKETNEQDKFNTKEHVVDSSSSSSESEELIAQACEEKGKKKVRGPTRLDILPVSERKRKKVKWNNLGQPIGKLSVTLSSTLGVLIRQYLPITVNNWKQVDNQLKDRLWSLILVYMS